MERWGGIWNELHSPLPHIPKPQNPLFVFTYFLHSDSTGQWSMRKVYGGTKMGGWVGMTRKLELFSLFPPSFRIPH